MGKTALVRQTDAVRKVMMWPVAVIDGAASMRQAAEALAADEIGVRHLPVQEGELVAGVVSVRDVLAVLADAASEEGNVLVVDSGTRIVVRGD